MVALDALSTDQSSRALGCAQGAHYGCPKAAASSLEQIVSTKAGSFTHDKEMQPQRFRFGELVSEPEDRAKKKKLAGGPAVAGVVEYRYAQRGRRCDGEGASETSRTQHRTPWGLPTTTC